MHCSYPTKFKVERTCNQGFYTQTEKMIGGVATRVTEDWLEFKVVENGMHCHKIAIESGDGASANPPRGKVCFAVGAKDLLFATVPPSFAALAARLNLFDTLMQVS
eukprot:SAG11_NODE_474_length_9142_cov_6.507907_8_plen_106_part_00